MPLPESNRPSAIKSLIPSVGGGFCQRFVTFVTGLGQAFYDRVFFETTETGMPTEEYKTDLCVALAACLGGGDNGSTEPPNPNMPAPLSLIASDDAYSDKINISWNPVTAPSGIASVTAYKLYRSTTTSFSDAALIATIAAPTVSYEDPVDGDLTAGTNFWYWVSATNGADTSAVSNRDQGRAASGGEIGVLDDITDLAATQGFSVTGGGVIGLVWTEPAGATKYDIYRHTANDFAAATIIGTDLVANDATAVITVAGPDSLWDNGDSMLFWHTPPSETVHYYFWVVAKADSPPALSGESNEAIGWVRSTHLPFTAGIFSMERNETAVEGTDFIGTNIRVILFGGGGAGAGGSQAYGSGGGGGGGVVIEEFVLTATDTIGVISTPDVDETGNAPATISGETGAITEFQINSVTVMTANSGGGGQFSASGGGTGGPGSAGSSGDTAPTIYEGHAGNPGDGAAGGASGYRFGNRRYPAAHFNGFGFGTWDGNGSGFGGVGGGSKAAPGTEVLATGGKGRSGFAVIAYGP